MEGKGRGLNSHSVEGREREKGVRVLEVEEEDDVTPHTPLTRPSRSTQENQTCPNLSTSPTSLRPLPYIAVPGHDGTSQPFGCVVATELPVRHTLGPSQIHSSVPYQALLRHFS